MCGTSLSNYTYLIKVYHSIGIILFVRTVKSKRDVVKDNTNQMPKYYAKNILGTFNNFDYNLVINSHQRRTVSHTNMTHITNTGKIK